MLISIIMPCYNSEKTIVEAIDSIILQSYQNWELLVYDDASTDQTVTILKEYALMDRRIKVSLNSENVGPGANRNKAIENSRGDFIAFLDSDDSWHEDKLLIQMNFMRERDLDFSHHAYKYFRVNRPGNSVFSSAVFKAKQIGRFEYLTKRGFGYCNTFMVSKQIKNDILFNEIDAVAEDFEAFLPYFDNGGISLGIPKTLGFIRLSNYSRSSSKFKVLSFMLKFYLFKMRGNFVTNCYYFICYLFDVAYNKLVFTRSSIYSVK